MFLHGSRSELNVGDRLIPGSQIGLSDNGGHSSHVYLTMTCGFSLSDCENSSDYTTAFEFAVKEALWWGGYAFVYVVKPLGKLSYDDNHDASPACLKAEGAIIEAKFLLSNYPDVNSLVKAVKELE